MGFALASFIYMGTLSFFFYWRRNEAVQDGLDCAFENELTGQTVDIGAKWLVAMNLACFIFMILALFALFSIISGWFHVLRIASYIVTCLGQLMYLFIAIWLTSVRFGETGVHCAAIYGYEG